MTSDEYRDQISALIRKAPRQEAIASVKTARKFKDVVKKTASLEGKSLAALQSIFNSLRLYY